MAKWCNQYNCWQSDVGDIADSMNDCDYDCSDCEYSEEIRPSR